MAYQGGLQKSKYTILSRSLLPVAITYNSDKLGESIATCCPTVRDRFPNLLPEPTTDRPKKITGDRTLQVSRAKVEFQLTDI